jgi:hypothetical protein
MRDNLTSYVIARSAKHDVAIQYLVIADLSAITLNVFFETTHLYRRNIFDFVRIKREDLFELFCKNNESRNAQSKTKIQGYL